MNLPEGPKCPNCGWWSVEPNPCPNCEGGGAVYVGEGDWLTCSDCDGTGGGWICTECDHTWED